MSTLILQTAGRTLFHTLIVFSLFLLFTGHNAPGGGFVGGLVAGGALILRYVAEGSDDLRRLVPVTPPSVLGAGLACAAVAGAVGLVAGESFLTYEALELTLPLFGSVKLATVLLFDIGVYLIVVGMVYAILESLGAEMDASHMDVSGGVP